MFEPIRRRYVRNGLRSHRVLLFAFSTMYVLTPNWAYAGGDCDGNGVADSLETNVHSDCDADGQLDVCEIDGALGGNVSAAAYGPPLSVQFTQTGFGNSTLGAVDFANGSELDLAFANIRGGVLYLMLTGNLESNGNKLEVFIDSILGGQNRLRGDNPNVDGNGLNRMGDSGVGNGLRFDAAFEADFYLTVTGINNGGIYEMSASYATLPTGGGGVGRLLGVGGAGTDGALSGGDNPDHIRVTIDNRNISGVSAGTGGSDGGGALMGVELAIPLSAIGNPAGAIKICAFINGQLHDFVSNQVLGPLYGGSNLGEPRNVNFAFAIGDQFFSVEPNQPDCNTNGVTDACDTLHGDADCNGDGVPDTCETDCDSDGVTDVCEIAAGSSGDVNGNLQPDICDSVPSCDETLRLMTFNIRYGTASDGSNHWLNRRDLVFQVFDDHQPDIVGIQEALRFQLDEIHDAIPGYGEAGVGRENGTQGEYSAILYRQDRFQLLGSATFWLSPTPDVPGSIGWGAVLPRICTWVRLRDLRSGQVFYVANLHLSHVSQLARENSVSLLLDRIAPWTDPVFITGDFNAGEANAAIINLKISGPFEDTFRVINPGAVNVGTFNFFNGTITGDKIDYVFAQPGATVLNAQILYDNDAGRYPSDHYPVNSIVQFPGVCNLAADCNSNGRADDLDILISQSSDCNATTIPDECESGSGDSTGDGLVTLADFRDLIDCLTGPECEPAPCAAPAYSNPCCVIFDADQDGDLDLGDFAAMTEIP